MNVLSRLTFFSFAKCATIFQQNCELLSGKYVASFGDGPGRYKQLLMDSGLLKGYDAYDGAPFSEKTSEGRVQYLDLTLPQYGLPLYEWVISLEVAEHIPRDYENIYLDNIVRYAKEGVILSWAKPGKSFFVIVFFPTRKATSTYSWPENFPETIFSNIYSTIRAYNVAYVWTSPCHRISLQYTVI